MGLGREDFAVFSVVYPTYAKGFGVAGVVALCVMSGASSARADCITSTSPIPMSYAQRPAPETPFRAHMLRRATHRPAGVHPPRRHQVRRVAVKRAVHRPAHKLRPRAVAAAPSPPARRPTPVAQAAREVATPRSFALIATTICETSPAATPVLYMARAPQAPDVGLGAPAETPGTPPSPEAVWTPLPFTPGLPSPRIDTLTPVSPPVTGQPPAPQPPTEQPPTEQPPPDQPPPDTPPVVGPPPGPPPIDLPPTESPPPVGPPPVGPPPPAVPEPGAWLLLLVGFGGLGSALRRRRKPHKCVSLRANAQT